MNKIVVSAVIGAAVVGGLVFALNRPEPHSSPVAKRDISDHEGIRRDPVIAAIQSRRDSIDLAQWHSAHSFRFGDRSTAERGTQTLQRLIRVPQLARDSIVVLADLR